LYPSLSIRVGYAVNGTGIPDVDFDVGESYSGLLSLSDDPDGDQQLFFWFFPSVNNASSNEILIWLNGGVSEIKQARLMETNTKTSPAVPHSVACSTRTDRFFGNLEPTSRSPIPGVGTG
jgi:hypothetical protein